MNKELADKIFLYLTLIPKGKVSTYGDIALFLGNKHLCRVVGNVLHTNKEPFKYPCYKIVNSKGYLSSNYAFGGLNGQKQLLIEDRIEVANNKVDLSKYRFSLK